MKIFTRLIFCLSLLMTGNAFAQTVNSYSFAQTNGTYTEITGGTVMGTSTTATSFDSQLWPIANGSIPFNFKFNGTDYTGCSVNSNGYITFGTTTSSSFTSTALSSTTAYSGAIAAWSGDLCGVFVTGLITGVTRWEVVGTAPNREFVIQFKNWRPAYSSSTTVIPFINFQIRLAETTNEVKIVYGPNGYAIGAAAASGTRQIGLRGAANTDFINRTNATTLAFGSSTPGTTNLSTQAFNTNVATPGMPANGLIYTWTPPVPCAGTPLSGVISAAQATQNLCPGSAVAALTATGSSLAVPGITYQWEQSTDAAFTTPANAVGGTGATTITYTPPSVPNPFTASIYYRLKTTCATSLATSFSNVASINPPAAPAVAGSNFVFSAITNSSMAVSLTPGSGTNRFIVINNTNTFTDPVNGATPPATAVTTYAGTGQQVIYVGTGSSVTVTGLLCSTTYYFKEYEYISCTGPLYYYNTIGGTNNPLSATTLTPATATAPQLVDFTGFNGTNLSAVFPGWTEGAGATTTALTPGGTTSAWASSTFGTQGTTAKINLYTTTRNEWIVSPVIALSTRPSEIKLKYGITEFNSITVPLSMGGTDDKVSVLISTDGCGLVWTELYQFNATTTIATPGSITFTPVTIAIPAIYNGLNVQIAFRATDGPVDNTPDYDFHIDDLSIDVIPTTPPNCAITPVAADAATGVIRNSILSWTDGGGGTLSYDVYFGTATNPGIVSMSQTATTYNPGFLNANTTYYWKVIAKNASGDAVSCPEWTFTTGTAITYCTPTSAFGCTDGDVIAQFKVKQGATTLFNNTSGAGCPSGVAGYSDYTALAPPVLNAGTTYSVEVFAGQYSESYAAWVDYNDDGTFAPSERIGFTASPVAGSGTANVVGTVAGVFPITLACNPPVGDHRLRVRCAFNTAGNVLDPCVSYTYTEIEDYIITVAPAPACPQPGFLASTPSITTSSITWNKGCVETEWDVQIQAAGGAAPTTATTPSDASVSANSTVVGNTVTFAKTGLTAGTTYEVWVRASCGTGVTSDWTGPITMVTLPPAPDCAPLLTPLDMAVNVPNGTILLDWDAPTTGVTPTGYRVYGSNVNPPVTLVSTITAPTTQANVTVNAYNTTLYWRIVPINGASEATGCPVRSFTTVPPPPPPANDDIANAVALTVSNITCTAPTNGTTEAATNPAALVQCVGSAGAGDDDVWYSFVAIGTTQVITLSTFGTGLTDRTHQVFSSDNNTATGVLTQIVCSDPETSTFTSYVVGDTYFVRVHSYTATVGQFSTFGICVVKPPSPPSCATLVSPATAATAVVSGTPLTWTAPTTGDAPAFYDVYHGTTNPPTTFTTVTAPALSTIPTRLPSTTYFWYVVPRNAGGSAVGCDATIFSYTTDVPPPPPANDDPSSAVDVVPTTMGATQSGTTESATATQTVTAPIDFSGIPAPTVGGYSGGDVWFKVTVPANTDSLIFAGIVTSAMTDGAMAIYKSSNNMATGTFTLLTDNDDDGIAPNANMPLIAIKRTTSGLAAGDVVFVRMWEYFNDNQGAFNLYARTKEEPSATLNLTAFIEGYMDGTSPTMKPVMMNSGMGMSTTDCDNITVELHNATAPFALAYTVTATLSTSGTLTCTYPAAVNGGSYYIRLKHRNSVSTWSASAITFGTTTTYDFSNAANKALGDNMILINGKYALYSGDITQDSNIETGDFTAWETDANNFESGYIPTDIDGDGNAATSDFTVWETNSVLFISEIAPQ
jgi:hypothetical protein